MVADTTSDETLAKQAQSGDLDAYDEIVLRYQKRLWGLLFKFCPDRAELEDLVQNVFIKAYQNIDQWRPSGSFKNWLMRVAVNTGYDYFRQRKCEPIAVAQRSARDSEIDPLTLLAEQVSPDSRHPNAELIDLLLAKLKPEDRMLVTLYYYQGYTLPEIGDRLDWGLSKAKVKCHRARKKLEVLLSEHQLALE